MQYIFTELTISLSPYEERRMAMIDSKVYSQATLTVGDLQRILRIGQVAAYALVRSNSFPVVRIGRSYRIPQETFISWMQSSNPTTKAPSTAIDNNSCTLSKLKYGGLSYGK